MSQIKDKIEKDFVEALKNKDALRVSVLRFLKSALHNLEIEKKAKLTDADIYQAVQKQVKQRRDSIAEFKKGNRQDLVEKEEGEIEILKAYLPKEMDEKELEVLIEEAISQTGAQNKTDSGKVMGVLMPKLKGKVEGGRLHQKVSEKLEG